MKLNSYWVLAGLAGIVFLQAFAAWRASKRQGCAMSKGARLVNGLLMIGSAGFAILLALHKHRAKLVPKAAGYLGQFSAAETGLE